MPACFKFPSPSRPRRAALALALTLLLPQLPACANPPPGAAASPVLISIIDRESGQALPVYRKDRREHVAGRPAARYAIRLANRSGERVLVVLSVDGVNVVTGQTAAWSQRGYVLDPWARYDIAGWRKSETEIAAFEFAALDDAYATLTGRPGNVGVIGMAVFAEKVAPPVVLAPPVIARDSAAPAPLAAAAPPPRTGTADAAKSAAAPQAANRSADNGPPPTFAAERRERLGTAHGAREWSVSTTTAFERAGPAPIALVEIAYDSYANLVAAGVIPAPTPPQARAFPLNGDPRGFVPDPPSR
jgi:hypothetical protein